MKQILFFLIIVLYVYSFNTIEQQKQQYSKLLELYCSIDNTQNQINQINETLSCIESERIKRYLSKSKAVFLDSMGFQESSNRYYVENEFGYLGKYQLSLTLIHDLGYQHVTKKQFLSNPELQEEIMDVLIKHHKHIFRNYIEKYDGTEYNGVYITESGIIAAAHLGGAGNLLAYFRQGEDFADAYGTTLSNYMTRFGGYRLD
jgi:hypothetical protein